MMNFCKCLYISPMYSECNLIHNKVTYMYTDTSEAEPGGTSYVCRSAATTLWVCRSAAWRTAESAGPPARRRPGRQDALEGRAGPTE